MTEVMAASKTHAAATSFAAFADGFRSGEARLTVSSNDVFTHSSATTIANVIASTAHSTDVNPSHRPSTTAARPMPISIRALR